MLRPEAGRLRHFWAISTVRSFAVVALLLGSTVALLPACPKIVKQESATGPDGKEKGAKPITLDESGEGVAKGIVTYPGGDRVDWKSIELPKDQRGTLSLTLTWVPPRPGLQLAFDVFDPNGKQVASAKGGKKSGKRSRDTAIDNASGKFFVRIYAVGRGDAGTYTFKANFVQGVGAGADIPEPPRLPAVPEAEVPCDPSQFDKKNPACKTVCPIPMDPSWPACAGACPNPPDVNIASCQATMPCPNPPDPRVRSCPKAAPLKVSGSVINVQATSDGVIITVNRGTKQGVAAKWNGRLLTAGGAPVNGGNFSVIKVSERNCVGKVKLTTDTVNANLDVELTPP